MNRKDFVLVWKEDNYIYCNHRQCLNTYSERKNLRQYLVTAFCPFHSHISFCNTGINGHKSEYNNKTCIPIATLKDCSGRRFGCLKECHDCIVLLIQRIYHERIYYETH